MQVTEAIALEHASLVRMFGQIERVLPRLKSVGEVRILARVVEGVLISHAELEINFAFVALDHSRHHRKRVTTLYQDHEELDDRIHKVHAATNYKQASGLLKAGLRAARAHFREEERNLFPLLQRTLGLEVLTALGEAYEKAGGAKVSGREQGGPGPQVAAGPGLRISPAVLAKAKASATTSQPLVRIASGL
jgi:hypothetical protein